MDEMGLEMKVQSYKLGVRGIKQWRRENLRLVLKYGNSEGGSAASAQRLRGGLVRNAPRDSLRNDV